MKEALFYSKLSSGKVKCTLCYNHCLIEKGSYGSCLARKNMGGKLYSMVYGKIAALHIDPIEKKPLYHFMPGTKTYSIGTCGCNFHCKFCQNYEISQTITENYPFIYSTTPKEIVDNAIRSGTPSISYTYNEPTINYEFSFETAKLAHSKGLKNIFVSNGNTEKKPLRKIAPYLDAVNIDLKSFNKRFYKEIVLGDLDKVLETIKLYKKLKIHLELTTLLIPKKNDSTKEVSSLVRWIVDNLGSDVPLHFSRFYPTYLMQDVPPTPLSTINRAIKIAKDRGIKYVYGGNVFDPKLINTYCPKCGTEIVDRTGPTIVVKNLVDGHCSKCGEKILLQL